MTLTEIIALHEAADPTPIARTTVLTPKGDAMVSGYRWIKTLRALEPVERAEVIAVFAGEIRAVIAGLAAGA